MVPSLANGTVMNDPQTETHPLTRFVPNTLAGTLLLAGESERARPPEAITKLVHPQTIPKKTNIPTQWMNSACALRLRCLHGPPYQDISNNVKRRSEVSRDQWKAGS